MCLSKTEVARFYLGKARWPTLVAYGQWEQITCGFTFRDSVLLAGNLKFWVMKEVICHFSIQIDRLTPFYESGKYIFFILTPVIKCQQLAFHLVYATTVLNLSILLQTALLRAGKVQETEVWTEEHSLRNEQFLKEQFSGSEQFALYFCALKA